jgi:hypothetical protein
VAGKAKGGNGGLPGAASDFDALEKLRRLAFAQTVPAPLVQLELPPTPAESQEELDFEGSDEPDLGELESE